MLDADNITSDLINFGGFRFFIRISVFVNFQCRISAGTQSGAIVRVNSEQDHRFDRTNVLMLIVGLMGL